jgi:hypothetical protein
LPANGGLTGGEVWHNEHAHIWTWEMTYAKTRIGTSYLA